MFYFSDQIKVKADGRLAYTPCVMEITDDYLAFRKTGIAGIVLGSLAGDLTGGLAGSLAGGLAGDLVEQSVSKATAKKNRVILIPVHQITAVETKSTAVTALVTVTAQGHPAYTFACTSKSEMNHIAELLKK